MNALQRVIGQTVQRVNEKALERYKFFFDLSFKARLWSATAIFVTTFILMVSLHIMLQNILPSTLIMVFYVFGVVVGLGTFCVIVLPKTRPYYWLVYVSSMGFGGYVGATVSRTASIAGKPVIDTATFGLSIAVMLLLTATAFLWQRAIKQMITEKSARDAEIKLAQKIQSELLPVIDIDDKVVQLYGKSEFATEVGGDYFDAFWITPDKLIVAIGDVSGHNVAAGILMAVTKASFRAELRHFEDLGHLLESLNKDIWENSSPGMFVSFLCAMFDFRAQSVTVANAGHLPLLYHAASTNQTLELKPRSLALGLREHATFTTQTIGFGHGDRFLFYTDGVSETENLRRDQFGIAPLRDWLLKEPSVLTAKDLYRSLSSRLNAFRKTASQRDDCTILTVRIK
jgi:hypothetical protein